MTAPDPRLGEIEARLAKAEPGPWFLDADGVSVYYVFHNGDTLDRDRLAESSGADAEFIASTPADVAFLLDLARKQAATLEDLLYIAEHKADHSKPAGRWWAEVIRGTIARRLEATK